MKVFLYGRQGAGKSTLVRRAVKRLGVMPAGFLTVRRPDCSGGGWSLYLTPVDGSAAGERAAVCDAEGRWEAFPDVFDRLGVWLLSFAAPPQLIIMDEIGFMERDARLFQARVLALMDGPCPVLGVIKALSDPFLDRVRAHPDVVCVEVTEANRDALPGWLADMLRAGMHKAALPQNGAHAF